MNELEKQTIRSKTAEISASLCPSDPAELEQCDSCQ